MARSAIPLCATPSQKSAAWFKNGRLRVSKQITLLPGLRAVLVQKNRCYLLVAPSISAMTSDAEYVPRIAKMTDMVS
jgi:hypothetical protein